MLEVKIYMAKYIRSKKEMLQTGTKSVISGKLLKVSWELWNRLPLPDKVIWLDNFILQSLNQLPPGTLSILSLLNIIVNHQNIIVNYKQSFQEKWRARRYAKIKKKIRETIDRIQQIENKTRLKSIKEDDKLAELTELAYQDTEKLKKKNR